MVRIISVIGGLVFLALFLYAILPAYNNLIPIINNTTGVTPTESLEWRLMPLIIPVILAVGIIWHHFTRRDEDQK